MIVHRRGRTALRLVALLVGCVLLPSVSSAFSPLTLLSDRTGSVAQDTSGLLHRIQVEEDRDTSYLLYQVDDPHAALLPSTPVVLATSSNRVRRPQIVIDAQRTVHLLWQERFAKTSGAKHAEGTWVHYARLQAPAHGAPVVLQQHLVLNHRPQAFHPDLAVDDGGIAFAVWEAKDGNVTVARIPRTAGEVAYSQIAVRQESRNSGFPAIAVDSEGNIHLAWTESTNQMTISHSSQIVYTILSSDFDPVVKAQPVYTTENAPYAQPKSLRVDPQSGRTLLTWKDKWAQGPVPSSGPLRFASLTHGQGSLARVVVNVIHTLMEASPKTQLLVPGTLPRKPFVMDRPALHATYEAHPDVPYDSRLHSDPPQVEKLLHQRMLSFSRWVGAPPAVATASFSCLVPGSSCTRSPRHLLSDSPLFPSTSFTGPVHHAMRCASEQTESVPMPFTSCRQMLVAMSS